MKAGIGFRVLLLILGITAVSAVWAQGADTIDGVIWFNGWLGWELVLREDRFILTDHSNQATFRGTFQQDGDTVRTTLDPRKTVFLNGPSEDGEKMRTIQELIAGGRLPPGLLGTSTCSQPGGGPSDEENEDPWAERELTVSVRFQPDSISLTYECGGTEIGRYAFQRIDQDG